MNIVQAPAFALAGTVSAGSWRVKEYPFLIIRSHGSNPHWNLMPDILSGEYLSALDYLSRHGLTDLQFETRREALEYLQTALDSEAYSC